MIILSVQKAKGISAILHQLKSKGHVVLDILELQKESGIISSLKAAVLNAISSGIIASGNYKIIENCDPNPVVRS